MTDTYETCQSMPKLEREGAMYSLAVELESEGLVSQADLIDYPVMVELKDPFIMNVEIRNPAGYTWVPSALQTPIGNIPGIAVPAGASSEGLPLALQLIGRPFDEETLFALGETIEQSAGRMTLPEPWWA